MTKEGSTLEKKFRRYDIDWFRVIAILAVYLHHVGMPFNGDKFHIMNSESSQLLDDIMVFFEQFRLPLLFLISGTGTMFAFSKRSWIQFLKERSKRLLIPLIFGTLFIVPPQTYFERIGSFGSYLEVYTTASFETNHLWFIENLFVMSVVLIPLILFLKSSRSNNLIRGLERITSKKMGIFLWVVPLLVITVVLKAIDPSTSKAITNPSSTFFYGYFLISGMLFASSSQIWTYLRIYKRFNLAAFLLSIVLFYGYYEAIYPFYILHQTVIIIVGYYILQWNLSISLKLIFLILITFPLIVIVYRFAIYPFKIPRLLFGMKKKSKTEY